MFYTFRVEGVDAAAATLSLTAEKHTLVVDTTLLGATPFRVGSCFQFIGELEDGPVYAKKEAEKEEERKKERKKERRKKEKKEKILR